MGRRDASFGIGRRLAIWVVLLASAVFAPGCYYIQLASRQLALVNDQRPLPQAAEREPDHERRAMLWLVPELRSFARNSVQLPVSRGYTGYYRTDASGILFVVVGSERLRLESYTWWFPIVGSVAYKAFTDEADARAEAERLERSGFDAWIGRVTAYSSLGFFRDPVTSVMMRGGTQAFIEVLLHEMAHERLYVPGHTDFNEQLASFVGRTAAEQFLASRCADNPRLLAGLADLKRQRDRLDGIISATLGELDKLYESGRPDAEKLRARERVFADLHARFLALYPERDPDELRVNNARLLQYRRYVTGLDVLERLWAEAGGSWPRFWRLVQQHVDREL